jgi:hypothetical protein
MITDNVINQVGKTLWSSGKGKTHIREVMVLDPSPAMETIYHAPLIWIKSMKA